MTIDHPTEKVRLLLVDDDQDFLQYLSHLLQEQFEILGEATTGRKAIALAEELKPELILMDVELPGMNGLETTQILHERMPQVVTIILSAHQELACIRQAMAAGAREFLFKPIELLELRKVLERASRQILDRRRVFEDQDACLGRGLWCFNTPSGGNGQTSLMLSIANELVAVGRDVVVCDFDLAFGDIAFFLGMKKHGPTLEELLAKPEYLSPEVIRGHIIDHSSGIGVLVPPKTPGNAYAIDRSKVAEVILRLSSFVDYVLVDMPAGLRQHETSLLDEARFVVSVTDGRIGSIKNLRYFFGMLLDSGIQPERILPFIISHRDGNRAYQELQKLFSSLEVNFTSLPGDSKAAESAIFAGQPISRHCPESPFTQALRDSLVPILGLPQAQIPIEPKGILAKLFGW